MVLWMKLGLIAIMGILLMGCGAETSKEEGGTPARDTSSSKDVKAEMKKGEDKYTFQVKDGSEELKIQAEGSGDDSYSMVVSGKDGEVKMTSGSAAKLPENFPLDVPTYPGMNLIFAQSMQENETFNLQATSSDPIGKISDYFKTETTAKGWTETNTLDQNTEGTQVKMYSGSKGDRGLNIVLSTEESGTSITITTSQQ